jgi:4-carboxymuconolactone decarboxylase
MPYKEFEVFTKKLGYVPQLLELIKDTDPEMFETISRLDEVILKDGAMSEKNKRLIAMCMAAQAQCEKCVDVHAKAAMFHGATKYEVMEALFVAMLVGGAPCLSAARRTIGFLKGEMDPAEFAGE